MWYSGKDREHFETQPIYQFMQIYILFKFMMQFYEKIINGGKESLALLMENEMECALFWTWFCKHDINANVWKFKWNCNLLYFIGIGMYGL